MIAPIVWWITQPAPAGQTVSDVNAAAAAELAASSPVSSGAPGPAGSTSISSSAVPSSPVDQPVIAPTEPVPASPAAPAVAPAPAVVAPAVAAQVAAPVRIEVPALGVDTTIVPVGVDDEGLMEVPEDVSTVGWYRFGPAPGAGAGSAVLTGHVDDVRQGVGVFGRIGDLAPGDGLTVTDANGTTRNYTVLSREEWNKAEVPLDRLFDRGGEPRLVLITCGGAFDNSTLGYDDNIAITAVPSG
ncbi:MAG: class F sortase [Nakamurella sp.]